MVKNQSSHYNNGNRDKISMTGNKRRYYKKKKMEKKCMTSNHHYLQGIKVLLISRLRERAFQISYKKFI